MTCCRERRCPFAARCVLKDMGDFLPGYAADPNCLQPARLETHQNPIHANPASRHLYNIYFLYLFYFDIARATANSPPNRLKYIYHIELQKHRARWGGSTKRGGGAAEDAVREKAESMRAADCRGGTRALQLRPSA